MRRCAAPKGDTKPRRLHFGGRASRPLVALLAAGAGAFLRGSLMGHFAEPAAAGAAGPRRRAGPDQLFVLGVFDGIFDYLTETGYIWPLLGFILVVALFLHERQRSTPTEHEAHYSGLPAAGQAAATATPCSQAVATPRSQEYSPARSGERLTLERLAESEGFQHTPRYTPRPSASPHRPSASPHAVALHAGAPGHLPPVPSLGRLDRQASSHDSDYECLTTTRSTCASDPRTDSLGTKEDYQVLANAQRARHGDYRQDYLLEGVSNAKSAFSNSYALSTPRLIDRAGGLTARKVLEIERMLVQELEEQLTSQMGFLAGLFHTWRVEATLIRVSRNYEAQFDQHKADWESRLADERLCVARRQERWHQTFESLTHRWTLGDDLGLQHACFQAWRGDSQQQRTLDAQQQRVQYMVSGWAKGEGQGLIHACYKQWQQLTLQAREKASWEAFLDEESNRHIDEIEAWAGKCSDAKARARADVAAVLRRGERRERDGASLAVLQAWRDSARASAQLRRSLLLAVNQACEVHDCGLLQVMVCNWRNVVQLSRTIQGWRDNWKELQEQLVMERAHHAEEKDAQGLVVEHMESQARAVIDYTLSRWELGDALGLSHHVFLTWSAETRSARLARRRHQALDSVALQMAGSHEGELVHALLLRWSSWTREARLTQLAEDCLVEERRSWEDLVESQREVHADMLRTAAQDAAQTASWRLRSAHQATQRFAAAQGQDLVQMCLLSWAHQVRMSRMYIEEDRARTALLTEVTMLEDRARRAASQEQARLLIYDCVVGSTQDSLLLTTIVAAWRAHAAGLREKILDDRLEASLVERQRLIGRASTKQEQSAASATALLGLKDRQADLVEVFLAWSHHHHSLKQECTHRLVSRGLESKCASYSSYLGRVCVKAEDEAMLAACFWELLREALASRARREQEQQDAQCNRQTKLIMQIQDERNQLESSLKMAYGRIDCITETLQKELKTKEEMATELREAYDKLRQQSTVHRTADMTTTPRGRHIAEVPAASPEAKVCQEAAFLTWAPDSRPYSEVSSARSTMSAPDLPPNLPPPRSPKRLSPQRQRMGEDIHPGAAGAGLPPRIPTSPKVPLIPLLHFPRQGGEEDGGDGFTSPRSGVSFAAPACTAAVGQDETKDFD